MPRRSSATAWRAATLSTTAYPVDARDASRDPGAREVECDGFVATDERMTRVVRRGTVRTSAARDFTVKVDAGGLDEGRPYFYAFEAGGERSA